MNIALVGYGKMGKMIEHVALARGHVIGTVIDPSINSDYSDYDLQQAEIAIEFTTPSAAISNYENCFKAGIPVVSGTTGWLRDWQMLEKMVTAYKAGFFYSSNFSLGVNLTMKINEYLASLMNSRSEYNVHIEEIHHIEKLDTPSGTAISLSKGIENKHERFKGWIPNKPGMISEVPIYSIREGHTPGTHSIHWVSEVDKISLRHESYGREGFATGAVMAAEFLLGHEGIFSMDDLLDINKK